MNTALYSSATAMKAFSEGLGIIGNNLANVSTVGYKQQNLQYADLIYAEQGNLGSSLGSQEGSYVNFGQVGLGVQVDSIRTIFSLGGYESSNTVTDLAIGGKGFFQVTDTDGELFYTRAGNFSIDRDGILKTPAGMSLSGFEVDADGNVGTTPGEIRIDPNETMPPSATTNTEILSNLSVKDNKSNDPTNPYFSLAKAWDAKNNDTPLPNGTYSYSESIKVYDEQGVAQDLNIYYDGATNDGQNNIIEFVVGTNPGSAATGLKDGLLMTGTLTFDASGKLKNMTAFTSNGGDKSDLTTWVPATLENGLPQYTMGGQTITLDLGIASQGGWTNMPASAADVGTDQTKLGNINADPAIKTRTTAYGNQSFNINRNQDGYAEGYMSNMFVNSYGEVLVNYTNSQTQKLYEIPIARFVSEDGLRREGGNLFSAPDAAGNMELGRADTENYGEIISYTLETSNVDMSTEMVSMIITQRSFQSSSKAVTTADEMLQKAIELKRT